MKVLNHLLLETTFPLSSTLSVAQSELRQRYYDLDPPHGVQLSHFSVGSYRKGQLFHVHNCHSHLLFPCLLYKHLKTDV